MLSREIKKICGQIFEIFENQNFLISIFFKNFFFDYFIFVFVFILPVLSNSFTQTKKRRTNRPMLQAGRMFWFFFFFFFLLLLLKTEDNFDQVDSFSLVLFDKIRENFVHPNFFFL